MRETTINYGYSELQYVEYMMYIHTVQREREREREREKSIIMLEISLSLLGSQP